MVNAQYTVALKTLIDSGFNIGLDRYPIWDEGYRSLLNDKIINHFLLREIGFETPGMFKFYLNRTMSEIMPYYNELYKTTCYKYDPIHNVDYTEEYTIDRDRKLTLDSTNDVTGHSSGQTSSDSSGQVDSESTNHVENTNRSKHGKIDTPQGSINIGDMDIDDVNYASEVNIGKDIGDSDGRSSDKQTTSGKASENSSSRMNNTTVTKGENNEEETEKFLKRLYGNYGVKTSQAMIQEERELIINIDMKIINELEDLFMCIW